jgi:hypothetical protein
MTAASCALALLSRIASGLEARQHRLRSQRHRTVPALKHDGDTGRDQLVRLGDADGGRALVVAHQQFDLAPHNAAVGVDERDHRFDGVDDVLALPARAPAQGNRDADFYTIRRESRSRQDRCGGKGCDSVSSCDHSVSSRLTLHPIFDALHA